MTEMDKIKVVNRSDGWVCVEKPGGISVHNDPGKDLVSLLPKILGTEFQAAVLQPVHRLDRETSGLLLLGTDPDTVTRLSRIFAAGQVKKKYKALVHGRFDLPGQSRNGIWEFPLSKKAGGRSNPAGTGKKVAAATRYRVLIQTPHYALLDIELLTGRKHQIRRHAKLSGHPVTGDDRYGSVRAISFLREKRGFSGMGLRSYFLEFKDMDQCVRIEVEGLSPDMDRLLKQDG